MHRIVPRPRPIAVRMTWDRLNPWTQWIGVLFAGTAGLVILDRVFRPEDALPTIVLLAFILGVIAATSVVRPLGHLQYLARNLDVGPNLDTILACAVISWLAVRFLLGVTGNPRVEGGGLHIAHMLWGGGLMLAGIIISLVYLGRTGQRLVAMITGFGFGLFIDELGKFITSNNDYFYRPAVALVYVIFVALYLLFRTLRGDPHASDRENLVNAVDWLKEAVLRDHDPRAVDRARYYLERVETKSALAQALDQVLDDMLAGPLPALNRHETLRRAIVALYHRFVRSVWFERGAIGVFLLLVAVQIVSDIQLIRSLLGVGPAYRLPGSHQVLTFYNAIGMVIEGIAGTIGDALLIAGVALVFRVRSIAYRLWKLGVLIIMFVTGVIGLYYFQFLALPELTVDVIALTMVNGLIAGERRCQTTEIYPVHRASQVLDPPTDHRPSVP